MQYVAVTDAVLKNVASANFINADGKWVEFTESCFKQKLSLLCNQTHFN